jgi:hypothetical protein
MLLAAQAAATEAGRKGLSHWIVRLACLAAPGFGEKCDFTCAQLPVT